MAIRELLGEESAARFMAEHFTRLPFARPAGCMHLSALGSWDTVERILAQPGVNVLAGREGQARDGEPPHTLAEARAILAEGHTLGIRQAHLHDPGLAELADDFRRDFHAPVDVHLYSTPAGHPGFGWHYDAEEVFILQTHGSKEWWLRKNTVNPWPLVETLPADMRYQREIMPLLRCLLHAGDWLYIPCGYWHRTQAGEESISLSVGVRPPVALDALDFLRRRLVDSILWRQRLPVTGSASPLTPEQLLARYRELLAELGQDLVRLLGDEAFIRSFLASQTDPASVR